MKISPGTFAWADYAPCFNPPGPHPCVIFRSFSNDNTQILYISHADDLLGVGVPVLRAEYKSVFRENGGPLTDQDGMINITDHRGDLMMVKASAISPTQLRAGNITISLTFCKTLNREEWEPLFQKILQKIGETQR